VETNESPGNSQRKNILSKFYLTTLKLKKTFAQSLVPNLTLILSFCQLWFVNSNLGVIALIAVGRKIVIMEKYLRIAINVKKFPEIFLDLLSTRQSWTTSTVCPKLFETCI